jgi:hypothetical protein
MKLRPEFGLQHAPAGLYMRCECTLGTLRRHHENKLPAMFISISPFFPAATLLPQGRQLHAILNLRLGSGMLLIVYAVFGLSYPIFVSSV